MIRRITSLRVACAWLMASLTALASGTAAGAHVESHAQSESVPTTFRMRDIDGDGTLTETEFVDGGGQEKPLLLRDFKVFDANGDRLLSVTEFLTVPAFTPEDQRAPIPDPVVMLARARLAEIKGRWLDWDQDRNGSLAANEFPAEAIVQLAPGWAAGEFRDWDQDHDGQISPDEAARLLDAAYGVRNLTGELLRSPAGRVVDWRMFRGMQPDEQGMVARETYIKVMGSVEAAEQWFPTINADGNERFSVTAFATSGHRTDPVRMFLDLDVNLDGRLTPQECDKLPVGWGPPGKNWLAGFDEDGDGTYSLREFLLIPHVNLLATWHAVQDVDQDGKLSLEEFRFGPAPVLVGLATEYFRRLDRDQDHRLSLDEWPFHTSNPEAKFAVLDRDSDGELIETEFIAEGNLPEQRLRRDFQVFDADANGRLTRDEFLTIPHWVPEKFRTPILDPVVVLSRASLSDLMQHWGKWDQNRDSFLAADEFRASGIGRRIPGLENVPFDEWDLDRDGKLSLDEAGQLLDVAYGVRVPSGELLRSKDGRVADWRGFRGLDPDGDGRVTRVEYLQLMRTVPNPEEWYRNIATDDRESFGIAEFVASPYRTNPVDMFLGLDADLNARLTPDELAGVPADWGPASNRWLTGFDDDGDGAYSLREFMLIPHLNLLASWHGARDEDQDGTLSVAEFRFMAAPALAALSAEYFRRLDLNRDDVLSLREWPFVTNHPEAKFIALDLDADRQLTEAEFTAEAGLPAKRLQRDFKLFDADGDGRMTWNEFLTIPFWVPEAQRESIPDPVVVLSEARFLELTKQWAAWDEDRDGDLSLEEFKKAAVGRHVRGLELTGFKDWDLDHDQKVTPDEAARVLDMAFGVRSTTGEMLRLKTGHVVDWRGFLGLKPDRNGKVRREDYIKSMSPPNDPKYWFPTIDAPGNETFGVTEFLTSNHKTDPINQFLTLDVDLNGLLSPAELESLPPWGPPGKNWLPGFDDDGDGSYSLREFRLIPQLNLLANWHAAHDSDFNGRLSLHEFHFLPAPALATLCVEYFQRLDTDKDRFLSLKEWPFSIDLARAPREIVVEQRDRDGDGRLSLDEVLGDLHRPQPGDRANPAHEAALLRYEEAFRRADTDEDGFLNRRELATTAGLEAIAPGASGISNVNNISRTVTAMMSDGTSLRTFAIIGANVLLVVVAGIYVLRKRGT